MSLAGGLQVTCYLQKATIRESQPVLSNKNNKAKKNATQKSGVFHG